MGRLLQKKGDYAADELHSQAQTIYRQLYGRETSDFANTLFQRAKVQRAIGEYETAERLYERALSIQRSLHGSNHPSVQRSLNGLSELYEAWENADR